MPSPQAASAEFFGPVAAAYLTACGGWLAYDYLKGAWWNRDWSWGSRGAESVREPALESSDRPLLDLLLALAGSAAIFLLGAAYGQGWLLPSGDTWVGRVFWIVDNAIIYSPIAIVLWARRQSPGTVYLARQRLGEKLGLGFCLGLVAITVYLVWHGEDSDAEPMNVGQCLVAALRPERLASFPAIFLEGVAVAFVFVRLSWLLGTLPAIAIPAALFALAHVPGQLAEQRLAWEIGAFFLFNLLLVSVILWTVQRSRDVIWIGIVHYLMDVAIRAI